MKKFLWLFLAFSMQIVFAQDVDSYIELLKSDVKTNKKAIITEAMNFTEAQSKVFWPIYNEYEYELEKLANQRISNIKDFAANYDSISNQKADELIKNSFRFLEDRLNLNQKYYKKFAEALTPTVAAKYMQVEHDIQLILDIGIAANLPLIKVPGNK
jgi:hypothetical protein